MENEQAGVFSNQMESCAPVITREVGDNERGTTPASVNSLKFYTFSHILNLFSSEYNYIWLNNF